MQQYMSNTFSTPKPRFTPGDHVVVTSPGMNRHKQGVVVGVNQPSGDFVYRYRVQLTNGESTTLFGFEMKILERGEAATDV